MELHFDAIGAEGPKRYFGSLSRTQLAHAYLFTGPSGVGKKTFARRLAQSLLCLAPKEGVLGYDGTCSSCVLFRGEGAHHPDFLEHEGVLKIGDAGAPTGFYESEELSARDLVRQLTMRSYSGGMRVLLLGDLDFSTPAAANALLKFLEEPPEGVVMFLTTTAPDRLLPTIRSRTIEVTFSLLSKAEIHEILLRLKYTEEEAALGATLAGGSATRAIASLGGEEESLRAAVARWFFETVAGNTPQETWANRETLDEGLETLKSLIRDWIVNNRASVSLAAPDQKEQVRALPALGDRESVALLAQLDKAQRMARTNVNPILIADLARMAITTACLTG